MILYGFVSPEQLKAERKKGQELRKSQWWRQQLGPGICHHCGKKFPKSELTMDHLIPLARGGKSSKKNVAVACKKCNTERGCLFAAEHILLTRTD